MVDYISTMSRAPALQLAGKIGTTLDLPQGRSHPVYHRNFTRLYAALDKTSRSEAIPLQGDCSNGIKRAWTYLIWVLENTDIYGRVDSG